MVPDGDGGKKVQNYTVWEYRYTDTKSADFLLMDPSNPSVFVYIPFSQTLHKLNCKIDSHKTAYQSASQRPGSLDV